MSQIEDIDFNKLTILEIKSWLTSNNYIVSQIKYTKKDLINIANNFLLELKNKEVENNNKLLKKRKTIDKILPSENEELPIKKSNRKSKILPSDSEQDEPEPEIKKTKTKSRASKILPIVEEPMEIEVPLRTLKRGKSLGSNKNALSTNKARNLLPAISTPTLTSPPIFSPQNPFQSGASARFSVSPALRDDDDINPFQSYAAKFRLSTSPELPAKTKHTIRSAAAKSLDFNDFDDVDEESIEDAIRENKIKHIISSPPPVLYENLRAISTPAINYPNLGASTGKKKSRKSVSKVEEPGVATAPTYFKPSAGKQEADNQSTNVRAATSTWNKIAGALAILVLILALGGGFYYYSSSPVFCDAGQHNEECIPCPVLYHLGHVKTCSDGKLICDEGYVPSKSFRSDSIPCVLSDKESNARQISAYAISKLKENKGDSECGYPTKVAVPSNLSLIIEELVFENFHYNETQVVIDRAIELMKMSNEVDFGHTIEAKSAKYKWQCSLQLFVLNNSLILSGILAVLIVVAFFLLQQRNKDIYDKSIILADEVRLLLSEQGPKSRAEIRDHLKKQRPQLASYTSYSDWETLLAKDYRIGVAESKKGSEFNSLFWNCNVPYKRQFY